MREIKFRVWDKSNKIMYEKAMVGNFPDTVPVVWTDYECQEGWYHIEPKECEVMQYTGLKDKNDMEVYEGDIIRYSSDVINSFYGANEIFREVRFKYGMYGIKGIEDGSHIPFGSILKCQYEVIGNIYENPELLEGN